MWSRAVVDKLKKQNIARKLLASTPVPVRAGVANKLIVFGSTIFVLDAEDEHFHFDRSVLLPDPASHDDSTPILYTRRATGLGVICAALVHADQEPDHGLFVTGHTDPEGDAAYNLRLSKDRAENVSLLLRGKRDEWRTQSAKEDNVDDYQRVLQWQANRSGTDVDPGGITNKHDAATKRAVERFQELYNQQVDAAIAAGADSPFKTKIGVDGKVGKETWGAFYDLYMEELMELLGLEKYSELEARQAKLKAPPGMKDFVGCGEHVPFNPARRDPPRKGTAERDVDPQKNPTDRRVEILFFPPGRELTLDCHPSATACSPAECPVYHRLGAPSQTPLPIPPGLHIAEVNLRLTFVDPEGKVRPLPEGLPVAIEFGDPKDPDFISDGEGTKIGDDDELDIPPPDADADVDADSEITDQEPTETLDADGVVRFVIPRREKSFYLRILPGKDQRFIVADPKQLDAQELANETDAVDAVRQGRVFFQLPPEFDTADGFWTAPPGVKFKDGMFLDIDDRSTQIGSREAPVELKLEVRWQHFRFEYFDRFTFTPAAVPQSRTKDQPLLVLEGFPDTIEPGDDPDNAEAEARSIWDVGTGTDTVHCLAWVRRLRDTSSGALAELPSAKSTTRFQFRNGIGFVRTDGKSADDASRALVQFAPFTQEVSTPGVDRLRLYDLPKTWLSNDYPVRLAGEGIEKNRKFQTLAPTASTAAKPCLVSLDIIVLENDTGDGPDEVGLDDKQIEKRHALYDHQLRVYKPDTASGETYFTALGNLVKQPEGAVLHDFPRFTRLIARSDVLFDVFDERTKNTADFKGAPIGARLATRYPSGGNNAFFLISQAEYFAPKPNGSSGTFSSGSANITAMLRCCGRDGDLERVVVFQYMSVHFDFAPSPPHPAGAQRLVNPPVGKDADDQRRECLLKVDDRWNGNPVTFRIEGKEPAVGRIRLLLTRGAKPGTGGPAAGQILIKIYQDGHRATQGGSTGHWALPDMSIEKENRFTAAHELGHAMSLPDEYFNEDFEPSLKEKNITEASRSPGTPYGFDEPAMMNNNKVIRTRYFWHLILWAREQGFFKDATKVTLAVGKQRFTTALTARNQNRVQFPAHATPDPKTGSPVGTRGLCDLFLYATGRDGFTTGQLGGSSLASPFDGFISVRVKMAWTFTNTKDFDDMSSSFARAAGIMNQTFNVDRRLVLRGFFDGDAVRLRVLFCPRFVCRTFPEGTGSNAYLQTIDFPKLNPINKNTYGVRVNNSIANHGVHCEVTMTDENLTPGVTLGATPTSTRFAIVRESGIFNSRFDDDVALCFAQLVGLQNDDVKGADDFRPLFAPLAPRLVVATLEFAS